MKETSSQGMLYVGGEISEWHRVPEGTREVVQDVIRVFDGIFNQTYPKNTVGTEELQR